MSKLEIDIAEAIGHLADKANMHCIVVQRGRYLECTITTKARLAAERSRLVFHFDCDVMLYNLGNRNALLETIRAEASKRIDQLRPLQHLHIHPSCGSEYIGNSCCPKCGPSKSCGTRYETAPLS
jgi:hypothetical protein